VKRVPRETEQLPKSIIPSVRKLLRLANQAINRLLPGNRNEVLVSRNWGRTVSSSLRTLVIQVRPEVRSLTVTNRLTPLIQFLLFAFPEFLAKFEVL